MDPDFRPEMWEGKKKPYYWAGGFVVPYDEREGPKEHPTMSPEDSELAYAVARNNLKYRTLSRHLKFDSQHERDMEEL